MSFKQKLKNEITAIVIAAIYFGCWISAMPFRNVQDGLQAVAENRIIAFIHNEAVLKHLVKTEHSGKLFVLAETFDHYYVGMAVLPDSPLLEQLNRALLKVMESEEWDRLMVKYLGSGS